MSEEKEQEEVVTLDDAVTSMVKMTFYIVALLLVLFVVGACGMFNIIPVVPGA